MNVFARQQGKRNQLRYLKCAKCKKRITVFSEGAFSNRDRNSPDNICYSCKRGSHD